MVVSFCQDIYQILCKKYPDRKIYIIGDHHFYHKNIINYTRSSFIDVYEMNKYIIKMHNEIVGSDEIVIFLGDFCFKNSLIVDVLKQMNGHKYLIMGNHDSECLLKNYKSMGLEGVFYGPIKLKDDYLSHEPLIEGQNQDDYFNMVLNEFKKCYKGINYHGHIHYVDKSLSNNYRNMACEVIDYKPFMVSKTCKVDNQENEKDFLINSEYFIKCISFLKERYSLDPFLLISDYIYSMILSSLSCYNDQYFVYGSFGLLKKYDFLSKISDLDISFIYNSLISKRKASSFLKSLVYDGYESLKEIDGINLRYKKLYQSVRIFEAMYANSYPYTAKCFLDANLVFLDCYKDTDFINFEGVSMIEKYLLKNNSSLLEEYRLPKFNSQFLSLNGDMANLVLMVLFHQGNHGKKELALRELSYILMHSDNVCLDDFSDVFVRFFLKNIYLLSLMRRYSEIEYILSSPIDKSYIELLPLRLHDLVDDILSGSNSCFLDVYNEMASVSEKDVASKCSDIMQKIKM